MRFIDEVVVYARSGKGGDGLSSFRREAHVPRGGPDGGDGGRGGDVVVVADPDLSTLRKLSYNRHQYAKPGRNGGPRQMTGRSGENRVVRVPPGTLVYNAETGHLLGDLATPGEELIALKGGRGGLGNVHFKSSITQAPTRTTQGEPAEEARLRFELRMLAEVGLLGYPNAGKSTLIRSISSAKPQVADYPFTTLAPSLGVVSYGSWKSFVMADIPGLIEGAADGTGLGHQFLRHVSRAGILLHLVSLAPWDNVEHEPEERVAHLEHELARYSPELAEKPQLLVLSKTDTVHPEDEEGQERLTRVRAWATERGPFHEISALEGVGLDTLREVVGTRVERFRAERA